MILGIDAATYTTGIALLEMDGTLVSYKDINATGNDVIGRSLNVYDQLKDVIDQFDNIECVILEDALINKWMPNLNTSRDLVRLQGIILGLLHKYNLKYEILTPNHWKSSIGIYNGPEGRNRAAQKDRMIKLVKDKYNIDVDDNIADAIGLVLAHIENS